MVKMSPVEVVNKLKKYHLYYVLTNSNIFDDSSIYKIVFDKIEDSQIYSMSTDKINQIDPISLIDVYAVLDHIEFALLRDSVDRLPTEILN